MRCLNHTDSGTEFLNEELIAYCEQEQLTFTRGRPAFKNDQAHVEQKNGAVVREAVGCVRLVGVQAYDQLREVYQILRLVVNYFQPSLKLQAKVLRGEQVRRVYDVAQTPLQRLLASGVLPEDRQRELREQVAQIDPLTLSEQLDALRDALLRGDHTAAADGEEIFALLQAHPEWASTQILQERGRLAPEPIIFAPMEMLMQGFGIIRPPLRANWEESWSPEPIQGGHAAPSSPEEVVSAADPDAAQAQPPPSPAPGTPSSTIGEHETGHRAPTTIEQAIEAYVQEMRTGGRSPKNLEWHHTSLGALRRYLWRQFQLADLGQLSRACLQTWLTDLHLMPSTRTAAVFTTVGPSDKMFLTSRKGR